MTSTVRYPNIALSGRLRSGKDTVGRYLIENYGYRKRSFANELKKEVARGIGCLPEDLDREPLKTQTRSVLQAWGTDFRRRRDPDYWVRRFDEALDHDNLFSVLGDVPIVVTDVRFLNELEYLRERGFILVKLDMDWEDVADTLEEQGLSLQEIQQTLNHPSENEWVRADFHEIIESVRGDLDSLYKEAIRIVNNYTEVLDG